MDKTRPVHVLRDGATSFLKPGGVSVSGAEQRSSQIATHIFLHLAPTGAFCGSVCESRIDGRHVNV
jgi:hypothetical protein